MNVAVWVITVLLAVMFGFAGATKIVKSKESLQADPRQKWTEDFPAWLIKAIGTSEVLAAAALILPGALGIATWLVPAAAMGLALLMVGAAITHLRRKEYPVIVANLVLLAGAIFVAVERIGPYPL